MVDPSLTHHFTPLSVPPTMDVASDELPITLNERKKLSQIHIWISIPPVNQRFSVGADKVFCQKVCENLNHRNYGSRLTSEGHFRLHPEPSQGSPKSEPRSTNSPA